MRKKHRRNGFTLLQMLAVLAIVSTLATFAGGFSDLVKRQRALHALATFQSLFQFARSRAVYTGKDTTVCALDSDNSCIRTWGGENSIAVFQDRDGNHTIDAGDEVLRRLRWPNDKGSIRWRASLARKHVTFLPAGNTWQNGTLYYCPVDRDRHHAIALVVSHSGRTYMPGDSDGDGIDEDRYGDNLHCEE